MRHAAEPAQVEIPLEGLARQSVLFETPLQHVQFVHPLATADDFAVAFAGEHIDAQHDLGPFRIGLEVKCFHFRGITVDHQRAIEVFSEQRLIGAAEVAAPGDLAALGLQDLHRLVVRHSRERRLDGFEFGEIAFERLQLGLAVLKHALDDEADQFLGDALHVFQRGVGHLWLHHPELSQMAARLRFLGAESRAEAIHVSEGHSRGFVVELSGLSQVKLFLVEVIHLEKAGGALARGRREDWRVDQREAV